MRRLNQFNTTYFNSMRAQSNIPVIQSNIRLKRAFRSQSNGLKQSLFIDRWPLILFEKLRKPSTAFTTYVRKICIDSASTLDQALVMISMYLLLSLW